MYTTAACGYCRTAKGLLQRRGIPFQEINLERDPDGRSALAELTGMMTFPQILIDGKPLGGFQELAQADRSGHLRELAPAT